MTKFTGICFLLAKLSNLLLLVKFESRTKPQTHEKRNSNEKQKSNFRQPNEATNYKLYYIENQQKITRLIAIFEQTNNTEDRKKIPTETNVRTLTRIKSLSIVDFFICFVFVYFFFEYYLQKNNAAKKV